MYAFEYLVNLKGVLLKPGLVCGSYNKERFIGEVSSRTRASTKLFYMQLKEEITEMKTTSLNAEKKTQTRKENLIQFYQYRGDLNLDNGLACHITRKQLHYELQEIHCDTIP